ncbi:type VI secretion system-associated protein TagO [Parvularcula sp. IMCC14364]|uniref:type VI secretion system-associated protein TagO n=1 Tax=Parvularcula sp. IMCC14364 TaxID=3067902 RepID=UPI002740C200|nr:type VI secretion system-associated protein TagO [Parvularcula sp. IMCC14364]
MLELITSMYLMGISQDGPSCAKKNDDSERLRCYDLVYRVTASAPKPIDSDWRVREETSKLDDTKTVFMEVNSNENHVGRFGQEGKLRLSLRCQENTTALAIYFAGEFMASGASDYVRVDYRIDDNPASSANFVESTNNEWLGLWNGSRAIPFIKQMFGASTMYVRATPFSESSVDGEFNISGVQDAIKPLREACSW